jgi:predicted DsbA family dithiol-disulfide isomerase
MKFDVRPGTVTVFTDVVCGWSTVALHRFYQARHRAGLDDAVRVDHQLYLLEDVNKFPIPKRYLDAEIPVVGTLVPDLEWKPWQADPSTWPITSLLPNEAVHAAKVQSGRAAEQLDMALRQAFFRDSRPISLLHEILDVATQCDDVDVDALRNDLDTGSARGPMMRTYRRYVDEVQGSPQFVLGDGTDVHNPGIELRWQGDPGAGFPVVESDDPSVYDDLVTSAAASARS